MIVMRKSPPATLLGAAAQPGNSPFSAAGWPFPDIFGPLKLTPDAQAGSVFARKDRIARALVPVGQADTRLGELKSMTARHAPVRSLRPGQFDGIGREL
jgi:hypothetical protein